jgi:hypothetical protein
VGFELDDAVYEASQRNLSLLDLDLELVHVDYEAGLRTLAVAEDELLLVFVAPPWGDALDETTGLHLGRTSPPVTEIIDLLTAIFGRHRLLLATQIYESVVPSSLEEVRARFEWSAVTIYEIDVPGHNQGLVLGTIRWQPPTG